MISALKSPSAKMVHLKDSIFIELSKELRPLSSLPPCLLSLTELIVQVLHQELELAMELLKEGGAKVAMTTQPVSTLKSIIIIIGIIRCSVQQCSVLV